MPRARETNQKQVRIGCSGWNYRHWREVVYPKGLPTRRWLEHYANLFDTVEVNNTFYRLPSRDAVASWAQETPARFLFSVKSSRYLTHMKRLTDMKSGVERFYERIEPLREAGKLGPVLWQLPGNFRRDDERLAAALEQHPPAATASSSVTPAGSPRRCTPCCGGIVSRSSSETIPSGPFRRTS